MSMILNGKKSLLNVTVIGGNSGGGEWETITNGIVDGSLSGDIELSVETVKPYGLAATQMRKVSIPNAISLQSGAFFYCSMLEEILCPNVEEIGEECFRECTSLQQVSIPKVREVGYGTFARCTSLSQVVAPLLETISDSTAFEECPIRYFNYPNLTSLDGLSDMPELEAIDLPNLTSVNSSIGYNPKLKRVSLPKLTSFYYNGMFSYNPLLKIVHLPLVTAIEMYAFDNCQSLQTIDLPSVTRIEMEAFKGTSLTSLTLRSNQVVCDLRSTNSIPASNTHHITIKVPADLIESYQNATNWSQLHNNGYITFEAIA